MACQLMEPLPDFFSPMFSQMLIEESIWERAIQSRLCINDFMHHYVTELGCRDFSGVVRPGDELCMLNDSELNGLERDQVLPLFDSLGQDDIFNLVVKRMLPAGHADDEEIAVYLHIEARLTSGHEDTSPNTEDDNVDCVDGPCFSVVLKAEKKIYVENIDWTSHGSFKTCFRIPPNDGCLWHADNDGEIGVSTSCQRDKERTFEYMIYEARFPNADIKSAMMLRYEDDNGDSYYLTVEGNELKAVQADYTSSELKKPSKDHVFMKYACGLPHSVYAFEALAKPGYYLAHVKEDDGYKLSLIKETDYVDNDDTHFMIPVN